MYKKMFEFHSMELPTSLVLFPTTVNNNKMFHKNAPKECSMPKMKLPSEVANTAHTKNREKN